MNARVAPVGRDRQVADRRRLRDAHIHDHFGTLLALLIVTFLVSGLAEFVWARVLTGLLQLSMLAVAYFSTRVRRSHVLTWILTSFGLIAITLTIGFAESQEEAHGVAALLVTAVYLGILISVIRRVLSQRHVDLEMLMGALCVYFIIGLMFSDIYLAIDAFSAEPLFGQIVPRSDFSYFSFVTLTTVGYGDITAVIDIGRRVAVIEAMAGQLFLATAVARLVSLFGFQARDDAAMDDAAMAAGAGNAGAGNAGAGNSTGDAGA